MAVRQSGRRPIRRYARTDHGSVHARSVGADDLRVLQTRSTRHLTRAVLASPYFCSWSATRESGSRRRSSVAATKGKPTTLGPQSRVSRRGPGRRAFGCCLTLKQRGARRPFHGEAIFRSRRGEASRRRPTWRRTRRREGGRSAIPACRERRRRQCRRGRRPGSRVPGRDRPVLAVLH